MTDALYKSIGEVAEIIGVETHVLRFWEKKIPKAKASKLIGSRRYYTQQDIEFLKYIKCELHDKGLTIKGLNNQLSVKNNNIAQETPQNNVLNADDMKKNLLFFQKLANIESQLTSLRNELNGIIKNEFQL